MSDVRLLDYWSAPEGAGAPVACLATTFTFEADFFMRDCMSRFLALSTSAEEGDSISSIAAVLEEEERLSQTRVSVLVDRSCRAQKRNLRWDLLPVALPEGLLHAKAVVLLWEHYGRVLIGSANLTEPGYRRQIELALAIELTDECAVPRPVFDELVSELRRLVGRVPGPAEVGPKRRASETVQLLAERVAALDPPARSSSKVRVAVAPARPGVTPLARCRDVWQGGQPLWATVLSPFWDETSSSVPDEIRRLLTGRPAEERQVTFVVAQHPDGSLQAPSWLGEQPDVELVAYQQRDKEPRLLHAKLILLESYDWVAALVGSSNATTAGLGLNATRGHHELNFWIGCPATSSDANALRALAGAGEPITLHDQVWEALPDEDEPSGPVLPLGFVSLLLRAADSPTAVLTLDSSKLPTTWAIHDLGGALVADHQTWLSAGSPGVWERPLPDEHLPAYLVVGWGSTAIEQQATWVGNVEDPNTLPPPAELRELPAEVLLAALASTRPLPEALEQEARRHEGQSPETHRLEDDPLSRYDSAQSLLRRARHQSFALWHLQQRLSRPAKNVDDLCWRLRGPFGPVQIAEALVAAAVNHDAVPGEPHFLIAELALTLKAVNWPEAAGDVDRDTVDKLVAEAIADLERLRATLPEVADPALEAYARDALAAAR